jgi:hypothetical protein
MKNGHIQWFSLLGRGIAELIALFVVIVALSESQFLYTPGLQKIAALVIFLTATILNGLLSLSQQIADFALMYSEANMQKLELDKLNEWDLQELRDKVVTAKWSRIVGSAFLALRELIAFLYLIDVFY